jgi:hypothetical protein
VRTNGEVVKKPGIAETLDWASALLALGARRLTREAVLDTLGFVAKEAEDLRLLEGQVDALLGSRG